MWPDNETLDDFLNFSGVAETVSELIVKANDRPVSIGVSGSWGVGKSSLIKMIRRSLEARDSASPKKYIFVEFNAWLYQGYDDARAALIDVIATKLAEEAESRKSGGTKALEKAKELLARVNWFRTAKLGLSAAGALAGIPPVALIGEAVNFGKSIADGKVSEEEIDKVESAIAKIEAAAEGVFKSKNSTSPTKEIQGLRDCFEETLNELGVTLVVLIDDLDRCLPETTISTLEAIRLFLFLKNTAFVIAADNAMIKHAVRKHFEGVDDELVTNYFDKLIQIPIRVPSLGTQEVRAYMLLLFIENSDLSPDKKENLRKRVCEQLSQSWQGKRVDRAFIQTVESGLSPELISRLDTADRLAPIMVQASGIKGNPRLIKRFLNALAIRMTISNAQGVGVDETALVKMLLFERCGDSKAYAELVKAVMDSPGGKPGILRKWEEKVIEGEEVELPAPWNDSFIMEWLALPPRLADMDLRGVLYVSREHAPMISLEDSLSSEGAGLLSAMLEHPDMSASLKTRLAALPRSETGVIMDRVLEKARQEQEWGAPAILDAAMTLAEVDVSQGTRLAAFLSDRPASQIKASIVPKISGQSWAGPVLEAWESGGVSQPVKKAIKAQRVQ